MGRPGRQQRPGAAATGRGQGAGGAAHSLATCFKYGDLESDYMDVGQNGRPRGPQMLV